MPRRLQQQALAWFTLALAAALAVLPLALHGYSCGHDFDFHLRSWLEAGTQWHAGIVKPVWAFHPAWNAGEPRLLFYPPLSWVTGAALSSVLPWSAIAVAFTGLALWLSGVTMHRLLLRWTRPSLAITGACLYLANPYMLFCAYERTAYAELLAAAWFPLLLAGVLREKVSPWRVALPLALLWITNAPAGIMGCYTVLVLGLCRLVAALFRRDRAVAVHLLTRITGGVLLGFLLDSFYLFPFAMERKYIQLHAALWPLALPTANFLYAHDSNTFHTDVVRHASNVGSTLIGIAMVAGCATLLLRRGAVSAFHGMRDRQTSRPAGGAAIPLMVLTAVLLLLQFPVSTFVWNHAPQLVFMQFPWRWFAVQGAVTAALLTLFFDALLRRGESASARPWAGLIAPVAGFAFVAISAFALADTHLRQGCDDEEGLAPQLASFRHGDGFEQTDEYTPAEADNDALKIRLPEAWLAATATADPPNDDGSFPPGTALPQTTHPRIDHLVIATTASTMAMGDFLIVRLRNFPGWHISLDGRELYDLPSRADGLTAIPLPAAGQHIADLQYRKPWDQWVGGLLSLLTAVALLAWAAFRRSRYSAEAPRPETT